MRRHPDYPATAAPAPRANPRLLGHERVETRLAEAVSDGRIAGTWLLCGPPGIGKATLAFRLARFLLAGGSGVEAPAPDGPGGLAVPEAGAAAGRVATGSHGDLLPIARGLDATRGRLKTEISVDEVRRMGPFFRHTAGEGGWRVAVIDGAELMSPSAANAALKPIEEPPRRAAILLVSHAPGRLPPTLRSRCRMLRLRPLAETHVASLLADYLPELPAADRAVLARLAEGSPGAALALHGLGGVELSRELDAVLADLPEVDAARLHAFADKVGRRGHEDGARLALDLLRAWLARLIRGRARGEGDIAPPPGPSATGADLAPWLDVWEKTARLRTGAEALSLDRKQVIFAVIGAVQAAARS